MKRLDVLFIFVMVLLQSRIHTAIQDAFDDDDSGNAINGTSGLGKDSSLDAESRTVLPLRPKRARCPQIKHALKGGIVNIRSKGRIAKFTCASGFDLIGSRQSTCVRSKWSNALPICATRTCTKLSPPQNGKLVELYKGALLTFSCDPGYTLNGSSSLYCDGLNWSSTKPNTMSVIPNCQVKERNASLACDFERSWCGWNHDDLDDFNWRMHRFNTPSGQAGTGPSFDHTLGQGKPGTYVYIEASSPRKQNDKARLFSPVQDMERSDTCFTIYFHMYGLNTGSLNVYIKRESQVLSELHPSYSIYGDVGNAWHKACVLIPQVEESFQLVIEGVRGAGFSGDTAIDDVALEPKDQCSKACFEQKVNVSDKNSNIPTPLPQFATKRSPTSSLSFRGSCLDNCNVTYSPIDDHSSEKECDCLHDCQERNSCCNDFHEYCMPLSGASIQVKAHTHSHSQSQSHSDSRTPKLAFTSLASTDISETNTISSTTSIPSIPTINTQDSAWTSKRSTMTRTFVSAVINLNGTTLNPNSTAFANTSWNERATTVKQASSQMGVDKMRMNKSDTSYASSLASTLTNTILNVSILATTDSPVKATSQSEPLIPLSELSEPFSHFERYTDNDNWQMSSQELAVNVSQSSISLTHVPSNTSTKLSPTSIGEQLTRTSNLVTAPISSYTNKTSFSESSSIPLITASSYTTSIPNTYSTSSSSSIYSSISTTISTLLPYSISVSPIREENLSKQNKVHAGIIESTTAAKPITNNSGIRNDNDNETVQVKSIEMTDSGIKATSLSSPYLSSSFFSKKPNNNRMSITKIATRKASGSDASGVDKDETQLIHKGDSDEKARTRGQTKSLPTTTSRTDSYAHNVSRTTITYKLSPRTITTSATTSRVQEHQISKSKSTKHSHLLLSPSLSTTNETHNSLSIVLPSIVTTLGALLLLVTLCFIWNQRKKKELQEKLPEDSEMRYLSVCCEDGCEDAS